jgi:hypothetical protein
MLFSTWGPPRLPGTRTSQKAGENGEILSILPLEAFDFVDF